MIDSGNISISELPLQALLLVGLVILGTFFTMQLSKRYLFMLVKSEVWHQRIESSRPRIEMGVWVIISFLLLVFMLNISFLVTLILIVVVIVVGGRYWRDVVNGIVIKFENRIAQGDFLSSHEYSGVIVELAVRGLQIRLAGGDIAFIAYRNLSDYQVRKLERDLKGELCSVTVKFKPKNSVESAIKTLRKEAMVIPYTLLTEQAKVEVVELDESGVLLRVLLHTQSAESAKLVEMALKSALSAQNLLSE
tara:strand:+ start:197466 stop:198215 length:750 start_codon:yes stop_codon:yes gene_type:complete